MYMILDNSLYSRNEKNFKALKSEAKSFNIKVNGNNIIQDDIWTVLGNYAAQNSQKLEIMFLPIMDEDFCAFTCVKQEIIFVVINSNVLLSKQIFAAAHELYHIWRYIEHEDSSLLSDGSLVTTGDSVELVPKDEDIEANAFAGVFLAPDSSILEQMVIYGIDKNAIEVEDIVTLLNVFAMPYKAMVLRLYEESYLSVDKARILLDIPMVTINQMIIKTQIGLRWNRKNPENIDFGKLKSLIEDNKNTEALQDRRINEDLERINFIKDEFRQCREAHE